MNIDENVPTNQNNPCSLICMLGHISTPFLRTDIVRKPFLIKKYEYYMNAPYIN